MLSAKNPLDFFGLGTGARLTQVSRQRVFCSISSQLPAGPHVVRPPCFVDHSLFRFFFHLGAESKGKAVCLTQIQIMVASSQSYETLEPFMDELKLDHNQAIKSKSTENCSPEVPGVFFFSVFT